MGTEVPPRPFVRGVSIGLRGSLSDEGAGVTLSQSGRLRGRGTLVVEDDSIIALDFKGVLEREGAVVVGPATTLKKALWHLENDNFEAAVLDVRLEKTNTLMLADRLLSLGIVFLFQTSDPRALQGIPVGFP